jgi:hypothetical protein
MFYYGSNYGKFVACFSRIVADVSFVIFKLLLFLSPCKLIGWLQLL